MIRLLVLLAILVALAFGGTWLAERPGGIVMTVDGRQIQMTLGVGAALLAAIVVAAVVLWSVLRFLLRLPSLLTFTNKARRRARGFAAVSRGMVAVGAGDPRSAKRHASDASRLLGDEEPLALLLKAQTAQMTGDRGSAEGAFRQMLDEPETRVLGLRGLFVEARRKGDLAAARAYAAEAARLAPSVSWAGEAVLEYQCSEHDWAGALATLDHAAKGLDKASLRRQRAVLLTADALARQEREPDAALSRTQEALKLAPDLVPAAVLAGRLHSRRGDYRKASKTIEAAWKLAPHPELADAYVHVRPGDSARDRLARAEKLQGLRPQAPEGRIALAEAALAGRDFERVRKALAPLLEGRPSVSVCLLMADLAEADETAHGSVREWLARASRAPRDPAWIADGVISDTWAPVSPVTGRLDAFTWGTPVEQIALSPRDAERAERAAAAAALPHADAVLADVDEPEALLHRGDDAPADAPHAGPTLEAEVARPGQARPPAADAPAPAPPPSGSAEGGTPGNAGVSGTTGLNGSGGHAGPVAPPAGIQAQAPDGRPAGAASLAGSDVSPAGPDAPRATGATAAPAAGAHVGAVQVGALQVGAAQVGAPDVVPPRGPGPGAAVQGQERPAEVLAHAPEPAPSALAAELRRRPVQPTPVVFPLAAAPDDPGPDGLESPGRGRMGFLQ